MKSVMGLTWKELLLIPLVAILITIVLQYGCGGGFRFFVGDKDNHIDLRIGNPKVVE